MPANHAIEELVRESRKGNRSAFDTLVSAFETDLKSFVIARLGPALKAQLDPTDITQDTFLKAYEGLNRFEWKDAESFGRWLRAIAEHLIRNASRKRSVSLHRATLDVPGSAASPSREMRRDERLDRLQAALRALSPDHREVIELSRIEGLRSKEIAERMGRSPGAVRLLLLRALEQLKNRFGDTASLHLPDRALLTGGDDDDA